MRFAAAACAATWLITAAVFAATPTDDDASARCPDPRPTAPTSGRTLDVRTFGTKGNGSDDTAALQRALQALRAGDTLVFSPGTYAHRARLVVHTAQVTLFGRGATLHAENPADQALLIQADGVRVEGFTLTARTDRRRDAPHESRIAVWRGDGDAQRPVSHVEILDNRIVEAGAPGTPLANSSSSAAIFLHGARCFAVSGNLVRRSLADAIHVTGGSSHGRVIGNTVRESGDDMIAVVSYLPKEPPKVKRPAATAGTTDSSAAVDTRGLVHDVLIADNDLAGPYWGRGISVVGGERVTIRGNRVDAAHHAAGIYIAREPEFHSHGVTGVVIAGNRISRVQTGDPTYTALPTKQRGQRTGHGAIEIVAQVDDAEARSTAARGRSALRVCGVVVEDNRIDQIATAGIRIGDGRRDTAGAARAAPRHRDAGVHDIVLRGNRLSAIAGEGLVVFNAADPALNLACDDNRIDDQPLDHAACRRAGDRRSISAAPPTCPAAAR